MKDKLVGCPDCHCQHLLSDRKKAEDYSGGEFSTVCPNCGCDGFVTLHKLEKLKREFAS
jgi:hypothetical protein